jgi:SAM-dependent methyltransferase
MKNLFKINKFCRLCDSENLNKIVSIGESPVSEKYLDNIEEKDSSSLVPLDLYLCNKCFHVQLIHVVNPDYLWSDFTFKTSRNKKIDNHYEDYVTDLLKFASKTNKEFILDVGSNDGTLLEVFKKKNFRKVLGIDPASNVAVETKKKNIETIIGYMNKQNAGIIKSNYGMADIITANNVYAHVNDMHDITNAIKTVLKPNGLFAFEVSYLLDVIEKKLLGTVFHEHLSYHSLKPLMFFFKKMGLEIVEAKRNNLQGGSIVCYVQHKDGPYSVSKNLESLLKLENNSKLNDFKTYEIFSKELEKLKLDINNLLDDLIKKGKKISGFGSARSATTLIKYFNISSKISYIVDDNKDKHFKFTPGDKIQVLPTDNIYKSKQDYVIIFAWEHSEKIINNHSDFLKNGGKFINIFPKFEIIN